MKMFALTTAGMNPNDSRIHLFTRHIDTSRFGFFESSGAKEMIKFVSRNTLPSLKKGQRYSAADEHGFYVHAAVSYSDMFVAYAFTDSDYPRRVAYKCLEEALEAFQKKVGEAWKGQSSDNKYDCPEFEAVFKKYKDASKVDALTIAQLKVDATEAVLVDNIKTLLERHETLDQMVEKSKDLSDKTKVFYKNSKKMNKKCCTLI